MKGLIYTLTILLSLSIHSQTEKSVYKVLNSNTNFTAEVDIVVMDLDSRAKEMYYFDNLMKLNKEYESEIVRLKFLLEIKTSISDNLTTTNLLLNSKLDDKDNIYSEIMNINTRLKSNMNIYKSSVKKKKFEIWIYRAAIIGIGVISITN